MSGHALKPSSIPHSSDPLLEITSSLRHGCDSRKASSSQGVSERSMCNAARSLGLPLKLEGNGGTTAVFY